jgi:hypothetical protein
MTAAWSVVLRQPEAHRWQELSFYTFLLKHLEAVAATWFPLPDRLERERATFERVGDELWILEWDLAARLNEFKTGYQLSENLNAKKFSIVYHTDNFNAPVYKLIEDVEALLALLGGRDPRRGPRKGEPSRREFVETLLKDNSLGSILELIRHFRESPLIKAGVEARNLFVHSYRDEPDREWRWSMFVPAARLREYDNSTDQIAEELRRLAEPSLVDDCADTKADVLLDTLQEIQQQFRDQLYGNALAELAGRVSTQTEVVQQPFRWILEANQRWRDLLTLPAELADYEGEGGRPGTDGEAS